MYKLLISLILVSSILSATTCDWKTIQKQDGKFTYTLECHLEVGRLVEVEPLYKSQIDVLRKINESNKDLLKIHTDRIDLWRDYSVKLEKEYHKVRRWEKYNFWIGLGMGIAMTSLSVYLAGQLGRRN